MATQISVLGSTGSIGTQTLDVISKYPKEFSIVALSAGSNVKLLQSQIKHFKLKAVCLKNE